jgi:hypothetical protein
MSRIKTHSATQRKPAKKRKAKWSLLGDATANLKAWRKQFSLEEMIEMCNEPLEFEVKMRDPAELPKRRAG